jgi:hypothetical protein
LRVNVVERASVKHVSLPPFVLHARRDGESAILAGVTPLRLARVRRECNPRRRYSVTPRSRLPRMQSKIFLRRSNISDEPRSSHI